MIFSSEGYGCSLNWNRHALDQTASNQWDRMEIKNGKTSRRKRIGIIGRVLYNTYRCNITKRL